MPGSMALERFLLRLVSAEVESSGRGEGPHWDGWRAPEASVNSQVQATGAGGRKTSNWGTRRGTHAGASDANRLRSRLM